MAAQRFRVWFAKGERVRYISHLDVLRYWERAIRRAGLPLSYSQGFTPHPKLAFAGPLPLGFISEAEVMDVTLDDRVQVDEFRARIAAEATEDFAVSKVEEVPTTSPPPQAIVLWSDYRVDLPEVSPAEAAENVTAFLELKELMFTEARREKERTYDLRAAVAWMTASSVDGVARVSMRVRTDPDLTVRPEHVIELIFPGAELGTIARTAIVLDDPSPAREAWRRRGQYW